jgi:mannose-6-phosphate isomerase-like protein (cupin superfamily)
MANICMGHLQAFNAARPVQSSPPCSARATICGQTHEIFENQSIDIPVGQVHCLENHGKVDLHLIEIQSGTYLGEDDAQQHEDEVAA